MKKPSAAAALKTQIDVLEVQQARDWQLLKEALSETAESLRPARLVSSVLEGSNSLPLLKRTIFKTLVGLGTGWFSGKFLNGNKKSTVKTTMGTVAQFILSYFAANHADGIRTVSDKLFNKFFRRKKAEPEDFFHNGNHPEENAAISDE